MYAIAMQLFSHKEQISFVVCRKIDAGGDNHIKQIKPVSKRQILYVFLVFVVLRVYSVDTSDQECTQYMKAEVQLRRRRKNKGDQWGMKKGRIREREGVLHI